MGLEKECKSIEKIDVYPSGSTADKIKSTLRDVYKDKLALTK